MTAYVIRRNRGPSRLDLAYQILRKDEAKAKKAAKAESELAPEPAKPVRKKAAAKKGKAK